MAGDETCDDGALNAGDGCSAVCQVEEGWQCMGEPARCETDCGDGLLLGDEGCDDGNLEEGDGCSSSCKVELGWLCESKRSPGSRHLNSVCSNDCGDGLVVSGEVCDDGNLTDGDGCTAECNIEDRYECSGSPSVCHDTTEIKYIGGGYSCNQRSGDSPRGMDHLLMILMIAWGFQRTRRTHLLSRSPLHHRSK